MAFDVSFIYRIVDRYTPQLSRIQAATMAFGRRVGQLSGGALASLAVGMGKVIAKGAAFASALSLGAVAFSVNKYAEAADGIAKFSKQIGTSANAVNEWRFAAERSGVSAGQMDRAMQRLFRNVGDLKNGTGELTTLLKGSPVFADALRDAGTFDEQIELVINRLTSIKDPAQQAAAAAKFFGERVGPKMIPLLNEGSAGIAKLREEAARLHGGFNNDGLAAAEKYQDTVFDLQFALGGLRDQIGAAAIPAMTQLVDTLKEAAVGNRDVIATAIGAWFKKLAEAIKAVPWAQVVSNAKEFFGAAIRIALAIDSVIQRLGGWKTAIAGLGIATVLSSILPILIPILKFVGLIGAGFAALAGVPVAAVLAIGAVLATLAVVAIGHWDSIKAGFVAIWSSAMEIISGFSTWFTGLFDDLGAKVSGVVKGMVEPFRELFDFITGGFGTVTGLLSNVGSFLGIGGDATPSAVPAAQQSNPGDLSVGSAKAGQSLQVNGNIGVDVTGPGKVTGTQIKTDPPGKLGFNVGMAGAG